MTAEQDKRQHPRAPGHHVAAVIHTGYPPLIMCTVADISDGGAGLTVVDTAAIPATFELEIKGVEKPRVCTVVWKEAPHRLGVAFKPEGGG